MNTYKLTFTVTIESQDDPAARQRAKAIAEGIGEVVAGAEVKLQQVYMDRPPRGVRMGWEIPSALLSSPPPFVVLNHLIYLGLQKAS
jgi:hypothetical protein